MSPPSLEKRAVRGLEHPPSSARYNFSTMPRRTFPYPEGLSSYVEDAWLSYDFPLNRPPRRPSQVLVDSMLHVAYHATLTREEGRPTQFNIMLVDNKTYFQRLSDVAVDYPLYSFLEFEHARPFSANEIRRLAPAVNSRSSAVMCRQRGRSHQLEITGLVDWGSTFHRMLYGPGHRGMGPPDFFNIVCRGPGNIGLAIGDYEFLSLRDGEVCPLSARGDVITRSLFSQAITALHQGVSKELGEDYSDNYNVERAYLAVYRRMLWHIGEKRHGGTIVVVPAALPMGRLPEVLAMKYVARDLDHSAIPPRTYRRYRQLGPPFDYAAGLLGKQVWAQARTWYALMDHLIDWEKHHNCVKAVMDSAGTNMADRYREAELHRERAEHADERLDDALAFLASLCGIDGALVLTDRFTLLGFGAELQAAPRTVTSIQMWNDTTANVSRSVEEFGTRHRSAFRLCYALPEAVAFTVSQDGDVRMARRVGSDVVVADVSV